jgi:hypothetical protein
MPCETIDAGCIGHAKNVRAYAVSGERGDAGRGFVDCGIIDDDNAIAIGELIVIPAGLSIEDNQRWI